MKKYNYDGFSSNTYNLDDFSGPDLGAQAPDFPMTTVEGDKVNLLEFTGEFLVLELGSMTCPLFQGRREGMSSLVKAHPNISFSILYIREAHPGSKIPAHTSIETKVACANTLHDDGEARTILIDDLVGTAHASYGGYPNAIFIIDQSHRIVFRSDWNNVSATRRALALLLQGQDAKIKSYFLPVKPSVAFDTLTKSGDGALKDFLLGLPALIWKNIIRRNFLLLFRSKK